MKQAIISTLAMALFGTAAFAGGHASGDADAGERIFKRCKACHSIVSTDGTAVKKGGSVGPNLFGLYNRTAGTEADHGDKFGKSIVAAGANGLIWNEANFVAYVADPKKFLRAYLDDPKARSSMSFKLKKEDDALNVWAYLLSVGPAVED